MPVNADGKGNGQPAQIVYGRIYDGMPDHSWLGPTKQATEVRLRDGHKGTNAIATIAVELGFPDSAIVLRRSRKFPALWIRKKRAENLWEPWAGSAVDGSKLPRTRLERSRSTADACACVIHATAQVS